MVNVSTTSREEEARPETLPPIVFAGHSACNRRLSRAGQAAQPEDAWSIVLISPVVNLLKDVDAGVWEAGGLVLPRVRIEGSILSDWQTAERAVQS